MAAHASFTAADGAATPVTRTFVRTNINGTSSRYEDRSSLSSLGWVAATVTVRPPVAGNGAKVYKVTQRFVYPIVVDEIINGVTVPRKVREYIKEVVDTIPADGTQNERTTWEVLSRNIQGTATLKDATDYLLALNGP
jgi:predicted transcriptional regulator with HTH domain